MQIRSSITSRRDWKLNKADWKRSLAVALQKRKCITWTHHVQSSLVVGKGQKRHRMAFGSLRSGIGAEHK